MSTYGNPPGDLALPSPGPAPQPATAITTATTAPAPFPSATAPSASSVILPALLLLALAAAALLFARRRRAAAPSRLLEVIETASLGPRRSIVIARVGDELLVLGSSDAGIALLSTRPAPLALATVPAPIAPPSGAQGHQLRALLSRLAPRTSPRAPEPTFDAALAESLEDLELRRKLAGGRSGIVS